VGATTGLNWKGEAKIGANKTLDEKRKRELGQVN